mmetsp:Transcript_38319/g.61474  ORF Transcript_38319/g.61474 Transcript_38319/m.61474 type:complete len:201 (-) Transcript_38319:301-903(-)
MTLPGVRMSVVFGGSLLRPAGRTMVYSRPLACRYFSPTNFSSSTPPKAFVILNPGESVAPMVRPSVRIEETSTTRLTPAAFAASTMCTTPSLSTACAAAPILNGLPGTKPVHTMTTSAPRIPAASAVALAVTSNPGKRVTPPASRPIFLALSGERTAATTSAPPRFRSSSTTSRPVCPVAPTTSTVGSASPVTPAAAWGG